MELNLRPVRVVETARRAFASTRPIRSVIDVQRTAGKQHSENLSLRRALRKQNWRATVALTRAGVHYLVGAQYAIRHRRYLYERIRTRGFQLATRPTGGTTDLVNR